MSSLTSRVADIMSLGYFSRSVSNSSSDYPYTELEHLGRGAFGSVYAIECKSSGERFALKLIPIPNNIYDKPLINREIEILKEISNNYIVKYYDHSIIQDKDDKSYIQIPTSLGNSYNYRILALRLELCDCDLLSKLNNRSKIDHEFNKRIFFQVLTGIEYLHKSDIFHRDLKPANILLKNDVAKIADFGLAKGNVLSCDAIHSCRRGTPVYRAPEILTGIYNKSVDIYSLGVILIQLYSDRNTFENWYESINFNLVNFNKTIPQLENNSKLLNNLIYEMISEPDSRPNITSLKESFLNLRLPSSFTKPPVSVKGPVLILKSKGSHSNTLTQVLKSEKCPVNAKGKLLCLDGGGIRGLIEAQILEYLEEQTGRQTKDNFEWIAGTSTGGLLALYLGLGHSAKDCLKLYSTLKDIVFGSKDYKEIVQSLKTGQNLQSCDQNIKSHSIKYERVLKTFFGEKKMSDIQNVKVIITVTLGDSDPMKLLHYTNFDPETKDVLIWQVARATSAAPTYFRNFYIKNIGPLIDGGLVANNPTLTALTQITKYHQDNLTKETFLHTCVSLGTGLMPVKKIALPDMPTCSGIYLCWQYLKMAFKKDFFKLKDMILNELTRSDGHLIEQAQAFCTIGKIDFYRLNPQLKDVVELDETDKFKLNNMTDETNNYIKLNNEIFENCVNSINKIYS